MTIDLNSFSVMPVLARPGDPYVMPDGKMYQEEFRDIRADYSVPTVEPSRFKSSVQRTLKELPAPPEMVRAISCVFMFTVLGVQDREICHALGIDKEKLRMIRTHLAYKECFDLVMREFININSGLLEARLAGYAHNALTSVAQVAFQGKEEKTRLKAADSLLDRGDVGIRKNGAKGNVTGNSLRIVFYKDDAKVDVEIPQ